MQKYRLLAKKGEGTFSEVLKAQHIRSGKYVAMKCMKSSFESLEQVNSLREVQALRRVAGHPHIVKLHEVLFDESCQRLALVFELLDMNLYEAIRGRRHYLPEEKVAGWMHQLLSALEYLHSQGIFHRDIKPENILLSDDTLKLADLGSCKGVFARQPYTEYISTRWYRAPENLLTSGFYSSKMDLWGVGCVWFELMCLCPLFPGSDETDQLRKIHSVIGTPPPRVLAALQRGCRERVSFEQVEGSGLSSVLSNGSSDLLNILMDLLRYDPEERLTSRAALKSSYFKSRNTKQITIQEPKRLPPPKSIKIPPQRAQLSLSGIAAPIKATTRRMHRAREIFADT